LQRETYLYWFLGLENDDDSDGFKKVIEIFVERNKKLWAHQYISVWIKGYFIKKFKFKLIRIIGLI
jgi:hypothetical protein